MIKQSSLSEYLDEDKSIADYSENGQCSNCGSCCSNRLPLTNADINRIKNYIKKHNIKPFVRTCNVLATSTIDLMCPFRDDRKEICTIYEVRPKVCRTFTCHEYYEHLFENHIQFAGLHPQDVRKTFFT